MQIVRQTSVMPPVSRETVLAAVRTYGEAWTTQDPSILPNLFTSDAIYVERAYDRNATFRGLDAIMEYWRYQICGKQSKISFRHVASEMIRDADEPMAVVKWLAEFDNRRENRAGATSDKTYKRVRFCQMAKLIFEDSKICYLEEYAQSVQGPGVKWPGLDAPDAELWRHIRQDPEPVAEKKTVLCKRCGAAFPSRTQLFRHLKATEMREDKSGCIPIDDEEDSIWICLSLGYTSNDNLDDIIFGALQDLGGNVEGTIEKAVTETDALTWAMLPHWTTSAVVNVASTKMRRSFVNKISVSALPSLLNTKLKGTDILVHTVAVVDRPCVPERREFERYEAFIPWTILQEQKYDETKKNDGHASTLETPKGWSKQNNHRRKPLEETKAGEFVDPAIARRLRDGSRLLKDGGKDLSHFADNPEDVKIRIRTCTMEEPFHRFCRISVSMRQPRSGFVESLIGLLIGYARSALTEGELVSAARSLSSPCTSMQSDGEVSAASFPTDFVCLLEPALTRYEGKMKVSLCGSSTDTTEEMTKSLGTMEVAVLSNMENKMSVLQEWMESKARFY